jgi:hypothetical protein
VAETNSDSVAEIVIFAIIVAAQIIVVPASPSLYG